MIEVNEDDCGVDPFAKFEPKTPEPKRHRRKQRSISEGFASAAGEIDYRAGLTGEVARRLREDRESK